MAAASFKSTLISLIMSLLIQTSEGARRAIALYPRSVADFYQTVMETLRALDLHITINTKPNEVPIQFDLSRMKPMLLMMRIMPIDAGECCYSPIESFENFVHIFPARLVRFIFSGGVLI
jgi:hypothetical protein